MLERKIDRAYNAIPATAEEALFIWQIYNQNREALHGEHIPLK